MLRDGLSGRTHAVLCGEPGAEFEQRLSVSFRELVEDRSACGIGERLEHVPHDPDVRQVMTLPVNHDVERLGERCFVHPKAVYRTRVDRLLSCASGLSALIFRVQPDDAIRTDVQCLSQIFPT